MIFLPEQFAGDTREEISRHVSKLYREMQITSEVPEDLIDALFEGSQTASTKAVKDINLKPTEAMANAAKRGLKLRKEHGRGGTEVGVARARDISNRKDLSPSTVKRMKSFFARHEVDLDAPAAKEGNEGYPSAGLIAWLLWGGDPGKTWAESKVEAIDRESGKKNLKSGDNCGTGAGGFKEDNTCATGSSASENRDAVSSKEAFEEAYKNRKRRGEFLGVPVVQTFHNSVPDHVLETSKKEIASVERNLSDGTVATVVGNLEGKSLGAYSRGSAQLNNALRDTGKAPDIPDFEKLYFDTEQHKNAKQAITAMFGLKGESPYEGFDGLGAFEEFESYRDEFLEKFEEEINLINEFGQDMELLADDLTDLKKVGVEIDRYTVGEFFKAGEELRYLGDNIRIAYSADYTQQLLKDARRHIMTMQTFAQETARINSLQVQSSEYVGALDNATTKPLIRNLEKYTESTGLDYVPVYRGIAVSDNAFWNGDALEDMLDLDGDGTFTTRSFASTSTSPDVSRGFLKRRDQSVMLKIRAKKGAWVEPYTYHQGEKEVLLPRDQSYRIMKRNWFTNGGKLVLFLEAEEVND
jgi:hypothetical protein